MSDAAPLGADDAEELVEVEDAEEALEAEATADGELADGEFADEDLPGHTARLRRLLRAWCVLRPDWGYSQAMNFSAAVASDSA